MTACIVCGATIGEAAANQPVSTSAVGAATIDPVVGTKAMHDGKWVYFDRMICRNKFLANPGSFIKA